MALLKMVLEALLKGFYTLCALKSPMCIKTTVPVHGTVAFCIQEYHGLMHTGDFKFFRVLLAFQSEQDTYTGP
jgi:hypothetical protein